MKKRLLSLFLALNMVLTTLPVQIWATEPDESCTHHQTHTEDCGYVEAVEGADCGHVCGEDCVVIEGVCSSHQHDESCGYVEAVEGVDCGFVCELCAGEEAEADTEGEEELVQNTASEEAVMTDVISVTLDPEDYPSNEEMLDAYVSKLVYGDMGFSPFANWGLTDDILNEDEKKVYNFLKTEIQRVANGESLRSEFVMETDSTIDFPVVVASNGTDEALDKALSDTLNLSKILDCLLVDCPEYFYWYDKTYKADTNNDGANDVFAFMSRSSWSYYNVDSEHTLSKLTFGFIVSKDYRAEGTDLYAVDTSKTGAAKNAIANADKIAEEIKAMKDNGDGDLMLHQLEAIAEKICELTSYNAAAAKDDYAGGYGDPWQLIHVFDNDPATNVVCEGYSKAFQYLCDKVFGEGNGVTCYTVTGTMSGGTGEGAHMWNIVHLGDTSYLVDVTNSDEGTIGVNGKLFLINDVTGIENGYTVTIGNQAISYVYDEDTLDLYPVSILFVGTGENTETLTVKTVEELRTAVEKVSPKGSIKLMEDISLIAPLKIPENKYFTLYLNGHKLSATADFSGDALIINDGMLSIHQEGETVDTGSIDASAKAGLTAIETRRAGVYRGDSDLEIFAGTIISNGGDAVLAKGAVVDVRGTAKLQGKRGIALYNNGEQKAELDMWGGEIKATDYAVAAMEGMAGVHGGTLHGAVAGLYSASATSSFNIGGGRSSNSITQENELHHVTISGGIGVYIEDGHANIFEGTTVHGVTAALQVDTQKTETHLPYASVGTAYREVDNTTADPENGDYPDAKLTEADYPSLNCSGGPAVIVNVLKADNDTSSDQAKAEQEAYIFLENYAVLNPASNHPPVKFNAEKIQNDAIAKSMEVTDEPVVRVYLCADQTNLIFDDTVALALLDKVADPRAVVFYSSAQEAHDAATGSEEYAIYTAAKETVNLTKENVKLAITENLTVNYNKEIHSLAEVEGFYKLQDVKEDVDETVIDSEMKLLAAIANSNGATIQLANSFTLTKPIEIQEGKNIDLDLCGCSLTPENGFTGNALIVNKGTLTIKDSGTNGSIDASSKDGLVAIRSESGSTLNATGGTIKANNQDSEDVAATAIRAAGATVSVSGANIEAYWGISLFNGDETNTDTVHSELTMTSGTITSAGIGVSTNDLKSDGCNATISGGTITSATDTGIYWTAESKLTVNGTAKVSGLTGIEVKGGTVSIENSAEIYGTDTTIENSPVVGATTMEGSALLVVTEMASYDNDISVTVSGGILTSAKNSAINVQNENGMMKTATACTVNVNGGTLNSASGKALVQYKATETHTVEVSTEKVTVKYGKTTVNAEAPLNAVLANQNGLSSFYGTVAEAITAANNATATVYAKKADDKAIDLPANVTLCSAVQMSADNFTNDFSKINKTVVNNIYQYTLIKPTVTVTVNSNPVTMSYGAGDEKISVTATRTEHVPENAAISYQWYGESVINGANTNEYSIPSDLAVGTYEFYCVVTCNGVSTTSEKITVTVNKVTNNTVTSLTLNNTVYGTKLEPTANATFGEASFEYYTKETDSETYTKLDSAPSNVGTYYVKAVVVGTDNYNEAESGYASFSIMKKEVTAVVKANDKVFDNTTNATVTATVNAEDLVDGDSIVITSLTGTFDSANVGTGKTVNIDKVKVSITGRNSENYNVSIPDTTTASITNTTNTIRFTTTTWDKTYDGSAPEVEAKATYGEVSYTWYNGEVALTTAPVDADTYKVVASVQADGSNYSAVSVEHEFTIKPKSITVITLAENSYTYDGTKKEPTVVVKDGDNEIDSKEYSVSYSNNINAGTATVAVSDVTGGNYVVSGSKTFTINQTANRWTKDLSIEGWTYGETAKAPSAEAQYGNDTIVYTYSNSENGIFTSTVPTNAGTWYVKATVEATNNYEVLTAVQSFTIAPKTTDVDVTLTVPDSGYTYNGKEQKPEKVVVKVKDSETVIPENEYEVSYTGTAINAGKITVEVADKADSGNYMINAATATYIIKQKALTWDVSDLSASKRADNAQDVTVYGELKVKGILGNEVTFTASDLTTSGFTTTIVGSHENVKVTGNWSFTPEAPSNYALPAGNPTITALVNEVEDIPAPPELSNNYKLEKEEGISSVPAALAGNSTLNTPEKIEMAITAQVGTQLPSVETTDVEVYDVTLMVNEGSGWVKADKTHWPTSGKLTVSLPYPAEVAGNYGSFNFKVVHMFTEGTHAGTFEYPTVTKTANGLQFQVSGLSPIAVGWEPIPVSTPDYGYDWDLDEEDDYEVLSSREEKSRDNFIKDYLKFNGKYIKKATAENAEQILSGEADWKKLSGTVRRAINDKLEDKGGMSYQKLLKAAKELYIPADADTVVKENPATGAGAMMYLDSAAVAVSALCLAVFCDKKLKH